MRAHLDKSLTHVSEPPSPLLAVTVLIIVLALIGGLVPYFLSAAKSS